VGEKYTTIGSFLRIGILSLVVPAPTRPTAPIATTMKSLYDLIWGQCSESLRSRLRGYEDYTNYSVNADSIALLKGIRAEMTGFRNKQYLTHGLHKIMKDFYGLAQGKHRNNQEYYD
jgi:hypothetical protein